MPFIDLYGDRFRYQLDGPADAPVLVLSNSLGTDLTMWSPQIDGFARHFRVLRYDTRGHGASAVTPGPYTIAQLAGDVTTLLDALKISRASFCGISMGGATGMWLATFAAERFDKVVLCNTAARIGTPEFWAGRIGALRKEGTAGIASGLMERWFTAEFRQRVPQTVELMKQAFLQTDPAGYIACCEAIRDNDQRESVADIRLPTLVIAGTHDVATSVADGRFIAERIRGAHYQEFPTAHLSNIEVPDAFTRTVVQFLTT